MEKIYYRNKNELDNKINQIKKDGLDKLHVVSDFDSTLTKYFLNGIKSFSTFALLRDDNYLSDDYLKKSFALFDKYHPIELDETLDEKYKYKKMYEWWNAHKNLLIESGMNKNIFPKILKKHPFIFREGTIEFLDKLKSKDLPLLIFSAGIGNFIEAYLEKENRLTSNVHILSNTFIFDENGKATDYKNEIIHSMNKSETKIKNEKYKKLISTRKNVILLGDKIDDLDMVDPDKNNILVTICFLNDKIESKLERYKSNFDIVITGDGSMKYVNEFIAILGI